MVANFDGILYQRCLALFQTQIAVLKEASLIQKVAQTSVYEKQWTCFDDAIRSLNKLRTKLETLEAERLSLFHADKGSFYSYSLALPRKERDELSECYRALKMEAAKFRFAGAAFHSYLHEMSSVARSFLDAAFPGSRGNLYGKNGAVKDKDMRRIVLDKQF
ncbi:MAG: hypothetical protein LBT01_00575 [Spirochaetaceae bacterium]|jgi:hypothetical protein|nr:hypothetical protein [Spirochaetaceae bacterium]